MTSFNEFYKKKNLLLNESFLNNKYADANGRRFIIKKLDNCIKAFYNDEEDVVFDINLDEASFNCFCLENASMFKEILENTNAIKNELNKIIATPTAPIEEEMKDKRDKIVDTIKNVAFYYLMIIDYIEKYNFSQSTIDHIRTNYQEILDYVNTIENYDDTHLYKMFKPNSEFRINLNKLKQQITFLYDYIRTNSDFQHQENASGSVTLYYKQVNGGYEFSGILACPENIKIWDWDKDDYHDRFATDEEICSLLISQLQDKKSLKFYYNEVDRRNFDLEGD